MTEILDLIADYPEESSHDFYMDLYKKKEFHDLRFRDAPSPPPTRAFRDHQKIVARYLSHWTLYDSLLLLHDTGTGKSGVAAAVYDGLRQYQHLKVLYLTNNETLIHNFKNEMSKLSSVIRTAVLDKMEAKGRGGGGDDDSDDHGEDGGLSTRSLNKVLTNENFHFKTYHTFQGVSRFRRVVEKMEIATKMVAAAKKKTREELQAAEANLAAAKKAVEDAEAVLAIDAKTWANSLIIMDEVHHLVGDDIEKEYNLYDCYRRWAHLIPNKRLLLLTATPMRKEISDITPLLNIMLPLDQQLPIGKRFDKAFLVQTEVVEHINVVRWREGMEEEFRRRIKGYVSVVRKNVTDVAVTYEGAILPPMKHYRVVTHVMGEVQREAYRKWWSVETKSREEFAYKNSEQASLGVFPDGVSNSEGSKKYINPELRLTEQYKKEIDIRNKTTFREKLDVIRRYSAIYAYIIEQILEDTTRHIYVYCDKVNGSGIVYIVALLKTFFNFSILNVEKDFKWTRGRRCIVLNEAYDKVKDQNYQDLIRIFNHEKNLNADYCQVVFGTEQTKEGISLKRIRQIHVTTPHWHFGNIFQAIGRGIRMGSHSDLDEEDRTVSIYFHCSLPEENNINNSIDFYRYRRSETIDENIKMMEYSLLVSAFDCQLNKGLNTRTANNSPECYYKACDYVCAGMQDLREEELVLDESSYSLYYIREKIRMCIEKIMTMFQEKPAWLFGDLCERVRDELTTREVFEALSTIIDEPVPILFRGYKKLYMKRSDDIFYLVEGITTLSIHDDHSEFLTYYTMNPSFNMSHDFIDVLRDIKDSPNTILRLFRTVTKIVHHPGDYVRHVTKLMDMIPLDIQEAILTVFATNPSPVRDYLMKNYFRDRFLIGEDGVILHKLYDRARRLSPSGEWVESDLLVLPTNTTNHHSPDFIARYITNNEYKVYGYRFLKKGESVFRIRDLRDAEETKETRKETSGRACETTDLHILIYFLYTLGERFPMAPPTDPEQRRHYETVVGMDATKIGNDLGKSEVNKKWTLFCESTGASTESMEVMRFFSYYRRLPKKVLCPILERSLAAKDLLVLPPEETVTAAAAPKKTKKK